MGIWQGEKREGRREVKNKEIKKMEKR